MKTGTMKFILSLTLMVGCLGFIASCSDDDKQTQEADKAELIASIEEAQDLLDNTEEGNEEGQYLVDSKGPLEAAVTIAETIVANDAANQTQVNNTNTNLQAAIAEYESNLITSIAAENLVARWRFDEGTGTTISDESGNAFTGTFKTGHAHWGAGFPTWTADRHGNANKAIKFDKGSNIEVPYNTKLNPQKMSISIWFKQDVNSPVVDNQYMVAMNRWNGYKLNMQSDPKVFFTGKVTATTGYDRDHADPVLAQGQWYHAVVTFGDSHMIFYINGQRTRDWGGAEGDALLPGTLVNLAATPVNLTIGQDLPTDGYSTVDGSPNYLNWGGFFIGALDEIRIYNTVLTSGQVSLIYDAERPAAN